MEKTEAGLKGLYSREIDIKSQILVTEFLRLRLGVAISRILHLRTACSQPAIGHSLAAVHYGTRTAAIVNVHRFIIKSSLFTGKWVG